MLEHTSATIYTETESIRFRSLSIRVHTHKGSLQCQGQVKLAGQVVAGMSLEWPQSVSGRESGCLQLAVAAAAANGVFLSSKPVSDHKKRIYLVCIIRDRQSSSCTNSA